jgi:hypothetical protein
LPAAVVNLQLSLNANFMGSASSVRRAAADQVKRDDLMFAKV